METFVLIKVSIVLRLSYIIWTRKDDKKLLECL